MTGKSSTLPEPLVCRIAKGQTLIYKQRLHKFGFSDDSLEDNYLFLGGLKLPVLELEKASKLEKLYFEDHKIEITAFQDEVLKQNLTSSDSRRTIAELESEIKALGLFVESVAPYFTSVSTIKTQQKKSADNNEEVSTLNRKRPNSIIQLIKERKKYEAEKGKNRIVNVDKNDDSSRSVLETHILQGKDIIIFDHLIFNLIDYHEEQEYIMLNGTKYSWALSSTLKHFKIDYLTAFNNYLVEQAISKNPAKKRNQIILANLRSAKEKITKSCKKLDFIVNDSGEYYFCLKILEPYQLIGDDAIYGFGPVTVVVPVVPSIDSDKFRVGSVRVLEEYRHPFIRLGENMICIGSQYVNESEPGPYVAQLLNLGRDTLLHGYYGRLNPHIRLMKEYWPESYIVPKSKANNITNRQG